MKVLKLFVLSLGALAGACSNPAPPQADSTSGLVVDRSVAAPTIPAASTASSPKVPVIPETVNVPAGTIVNVLLMDPISTAKNHAGDQFRASLAEPLVVNGRTVAVKDTRVLGRIVDAVGSGRVKGVASMRIVLTSIMDGQKAVPIVTESLISEAEASKRRDVGIVGGATGVGAAIGAVAGGKKGAGIGALVGAGAGTGAVLATKGEEVEYGSEARLKFTLERPVELPIILGK